jgi:hypothetical protein
MPELDPGEWMAALGQLIDLRAWGARVVLFAGVIIFFKIVVIPFIRAFKGK